MTPLAAAEARLLQVLDSIAPAYPHPRIWPDGLMARRFEALLEGLTPHRELAAAYGAWRRALRRRS